jgi:hypothetical protein
LNPFPVSISNALVSVLVPQKAQLLTCVYLENIQQNNPKNIHAARINFNKLFSVLKISLGGGRSVCLGHLEDFRVAVEHPRELQAAAVSVGPGALAHGELRRVQTRVALDDVENVHQAGVGSAENAHLKRTHKFPRLQIAQQKRCQEKMLQNYECNEEK